jgi:hypothetical protein
MADLSRGVGIAKIATNARIAKIELGRQEPFLAAGLPGMPRFIQAPGPKAHLLRGL